MDIQKRLYERHRSWGSGPATDIDCILIEYDRSRPVALIEYKIEFARTYFLSHPNYQCIKRIADTCKLPFFAVRYAANFSWFKVTPLNHFAKMWIKKPRAMSERDYIKFQYLIRRKDPPTCLYRKDWEVTV
jgi:hypothetical protein